MGKIANTLGIRYVTGGPAQLRSTLNQIIAGMDRIMVRRSVDIDAVDNSTGTLLTIRNPSTGGRGRTAATAYPLDLTLADAGATFTGTFRPGVVNGLIPSNYLSLTGIAKTGLVYIGLNVTLTNAEVQTATFAAGGTAPAAFPTSMGVPPTALTILTHIVLAGVVYRVIGPGNPWLTPAPIFETDKTGTISPGEKSTNVWYSYSLTTVA